jgi:hypothetical protein
MEHSYWKLETFCMKAATHLGVCIWRKKYSQSVGHFLSAVLCLALQMMDRFQKPTHTWGPGL